MAPLDPADLPIPGADSGTWGSKLNALLNAELGDRLSDAQLSATYVPLVADASDTTVTITRRQSLEDVAGAKGSVINFEHYGNGTGQASQQTYGFDLHNNPGARAGFVGHQYSNAQAFMQLDNTDNQPLVLLKNTNNPTRNPTGAASGASATGDFIRAVDTAGTNLFQVLSRGELLVKPAADAAGHGLEIVGSASTRRLIKTTMNGGATGVEMVAASGSAGFYPVLVTGYDYGPHFTTSQDGASRTVLQLTKNGVGAGIGLKITNKGTGNSVEVANATTTLFAVTAAGLPRWNDASTVQTTVGAAGAASAPPATPSKWLKVVGDNGTTYVVPAYAAA